MSSVLEISESVEALEQGMDAALTKLARIIEDQMTQDGLTEDEKNQKTLDFHEMVTEAVRSKLIPEAKRQVQLQIAACEA